MDAQLRERFDSALEGLVDFCIENAVINAGLYERMGAYDPVIKLGTRVIPLLKELYHDSSRGLGDRIDGLDMVRLKCIPNILFKLAEGEFKIPPEISGKVLRVGEYTQRWLDENYQRYV